LAPRYNVAALFYLDLVFSLRENHPTVHHFFDRFTTGCARFAGRPTMLMICIALAATGVIAFISKDDLFISGANLTISIVTLLLLPILQATQNRDGAALQAKIDELIKASSKARDDLIGLESRDEREIETIRLNAGARANSTRAHRARRTAK
jgi:low affinity Fe/Cu permease